jgi:hypothetical protein
MKRYLLPGSVLDIGCGLGGPTALIAKHCGGAVHLLDGDGWGIRKVGYGPSMQPYNYRLETEKLLMANGVESFCWHDVGSTELPKVDNVVSLISWGWHYPVSTYVDAVADSLQSGGRLILDLRPGMGGEESLRPYFQYIASYQGFGKCNKTVWRRN